MARLIIEAVPDETHSADVVGDLLIFVSVSRADDGRPVTGLDRSHFRVASSIGLTLDPTVSLVTETHWEPDDQEPSGCYCVWINRGRGQHWLPGERYAFGIQVRRFEPAAGDPPVAVDFGQTVVSVESLGT